MPLAFTNAIFVDAERDGAKWLQEWKEEQSRYKIVTNRLKTKNLVLWNPFKNVSHEKNIAHSFMAVFYELLAQTSPDALLDGLHQDAHGVLKLTSSATPQMQL